MNEPIPALIVSGFLGAGKTTLFQRLLDAAVAEGVKLAIVSNEFGDTGIDKALLDAGEDGFVELDGGCVCCRLSDALGETLERLITTVRPDRLVLETSGAALPGEVVVQFWRPPLSDLITDEVVAIVVDAEKAASAAPVDSTFLEQVEAADLILLNKQDLVDEDALARADARLSELSGGQPVLPCVRADVDPTLLFPPDLDGTRRERRDPDAPLSPHSHVHYSTRELHYPDEVDPDAFVAALTDLGALRVKGFVRTPDGVRLVQGVGPRVALEYPRNPPPAHLVGTVVVIEAQEAPTPPP